MLVVIIASESYYEKSGQYGTSDRRDTQLRSRFVDKKLFNVILEQFTVCVILTIYTSGSSASWQYMSMLCDRNVTLFLMLIIICCWICEPHFMESSLLS